MSETDPHDLVLLAAYIFRSPQALPEKADSDLSSQREIPASTPATDLVDTICGQPGRCARRPDRKPPFDFSFLLVGKSDALRCGHRIADPLRETARISPDTPTPTRNRRLRKRHIVS